MRIEEKYIPEAKEVMKNLSLVQLSNYLTDRGFHINTTDTWDTLYEAAYLDYASHLSDK